ncbi:MAG: phenylalanine--tRNA ligase beta subunit-related protein, partial [bacterium]
MKVPLSWLNEFVPIKDDIEELKKTLTAIGLEAESFTLEPPDFKNVVIGKIVSRTNAPGNRGFIHEVEVGGTFPGGKAVIFSTIPDLAIGRKYPVALPGGHVGDLEITERAYEGFTSQGKFCCSTELELTKLMFVENADGSVEWEDKLTDENGKPLTIFPNCEELPIGTDLANWLADEKVLEVELTSNRADCHSMVGIAREMTVVNGSYIKFPDLFSNFNEVPEQAEDITIRIEDKKGCMAYAGLIIDDIKIGPSPLGLAKKLFSAGMRPISNMVDITNLVLYEFGQPLHAFDHSLLMDATILIRRAKPGEEMTTIDNVVRSLTPDDLVIADSTHPVAIAGVMGGFASEVTGKTKKILIESAWFDPVF